MAFRRQDFSRAGAAVLWTIAAIFLFLRVPGMEWLVGKVLECVLRPRKNRAPKPYKPGPIIKTGRLSKAEIREMRKEAVSAARELNPHQNLPALPTEILREIIKSATDTYPSPFSIHRYAPLPPFEASPMPILEREIQRKLHTLSMQAKVTVSQVSKLWREVSKEFLFNSIRICHIRQISLLGRVFEADERRTAKRSTGSTAPGWVRELWIDLDNYTGPASSRLMQRFNFDLLSLIERCPNIVVFRGFRRRSYSTSRVLFKEGQILRQIINPSREDGSSSGKETSYSHGRIELSVFAADDTFLPLIPPPSSSGAALSLSSIRSLELRSDFHTPSTGHPLGTIILPNLTHLTLDEFVSARYATALDMPRLQGIACSIERDKDHLLQLLTKYGAGLKELAILHKASSRELDHIRRHCINLETFSIGWDQVAECPPSVTTLGIFKLENVLFWGQDGQALSAVGGLVDAAPALREVRDLSWRSSVVRQRAMRSRNGQDAEAYRRFWAEFCLVLNRTADDIRLIDWRGRVVSPSGEVGTDDGDRFMDAVVAPAAIWMP
ncbi:hypothetical protein FRC04_006390 [Tulasnella sp. 424]|nr:hypothetical protein FRC04_006390 [Tulasnella sp. 424]KAG8980439.1 hypothetical protein FRC05_006071 [Tulasnella sp. 425]